MSRVDEIRETIRTFTDEVVVEVAGYFKDERGILQELENSFAQALADVEEARLKPIREALERAEACYEQFAEHLQLEGIKPTDTFLQDWACVSKANEMRKTISAEEGRDERED